jgi:hypothetical protein
MIRQPTFDDSLDSEFDEFPDMLELTEGILHGHFNMAIVECPTRTVWYNPYRRAEVYRNIATFEPLPLDLSSNLLIDHIVESLVKLPNEHEEYPDKKPRLEPKLNPKPKPKPKLTEEQVLLMKRDSSTLYETWLFYNNQLKVLRSGTQSLLRNVGTT